MNERINKLKEDVVIGETLSYFAGFYSQLFSELKKQNATDEKQLGVEE